jgi:hypothetical protein
VGSRRRCLGRDFRSELRDDMWGHMSERERGMRGYRFGFVFPRPWVRFLCWAEPFPSAPFSFSFLFFFSFSVFLISLITFANLVQIASNQLCKVSKIQNNIPEQ